ncbi:MAG: DsrE/DsrF/DrsH-like family protein [Gammaproteobacteria bacterium]|nr:DsrE/DsrF/DrsH-like family protein [Gammaproteobacteria bacterium]
MSDTNDLFTGNEFLEKNRDILDQWFDQRFAQSVADYEQNKEPELSIMVTKGTLDWAYPTFIIASTAAALGWKVTLFFTFYGLKLLLKDLDLKISALGNPAMPMKMPFGPDWFQSVNWNIPNLVQAGIPGFESLATNLMKQTISSHGVASVEELREICIESEVNMIACQMTVDLFGMKKGEFIDEISEWAGAATFLDNARTSTVNLYI